ncbi:DUF4240 domain-containing protein [Actinoplanes subglobosus]|uniref:DUF4240 domain-containing protein n=1 Tax=Actinoplanes subglobosus TaxID=1547892 RepID=A0ABV8J1J3_9ACTN
MELTDFWSIVEDSAREGTDPDERAARIAASLAALSDEDLIAFQGHFDDQMDRLGGDLVWKAAALIRNGCGDDSFSRFRAWVIGLGREAVDRVVADPDHLAERPEIQRLAGRDDSEWADDEWPDWEEFEFAAVNEYERRHGAVALPRGERAVTPEGEDRELPRLDAMFPDSGPL